MTDCIFCSYDENIDVARRVHEYTHWRLAVQLPEKLRKTKQSSAGLLISRRHFAELAEASDNEVIELRDILKDASRRLCETTGVTYTGQETISGLIKVLKQVRRSFIATYIFCLLQKKTLMN